MNKIKKKHLKKIKSPVIQILQYNHWSHIVIYPNFCLYIFPMCVCMCVILQGWVHTLISFYNPFHLFILLSLLVTE